MAVFVVNRIGIEPANDVWRFLIAGDPSSSGLTAGVGSIAEQIDSSGDVWEKTGATDTGWTLVVNADATAASTLSANTLAALVGTSGTPNAANKFVTNDDVRLGGATGLDGISAAQGTGSATGDGVTDDRTALNTLANTTLQPNGGTIYFEAGTYLIGSDMTFPRDVALWLPRGAKLKRAAGVHVVILGEILSGGWQIFEEADPDDGAGFWWSAYVTGLSGSTAPGASNRETYPEWWGAVPDNTVDCTVPLQRCIDAAIGSPTDAASFGRYAEAKIRLSAGIYKVTAPLEVFSVRGFTLEGAGQFITELQMTGGTTGTADASGNTTTTLTATGKNWTVNQWVGYRVWIDNGGTSEVQRTVLSNTADTLTFVAISAPPDGLFFQIAHRCMIDLNGVHNGVLSEFSMTAPTAEVGYFIYYHREDDTSILGTSITAFYNLRAEGRWINAAYRVGADALSTSLLRQEDMSFFSNVTAYGSWTSGSRYYQRGYAFGTGQFSNNLAHTVSGIRCVLCRYGVVVNATSLGIFGGVSQSHDVDYLLAQGAQHTLKVYSVRSEGSRKLLDVNSANSGTPFNVTFDGMTLQQTTLVNDAKSGYPDVIANGYNTGAGSGVSGSINLRDCRFNALGNFITGTATAGAASTITDSAATFSTTNNGLRGWRIWLTGGTGVGQSREISSNTSTVITVTSAWTTTPDTTTTYRIWPIPRFRIGNFGCDVLLEDCQITNAYLDEFVQFVGSTGASVTVRNYRALDTEGETLEHVPFRLLSPPNTFTRPVWEWGGGNNQPDVAMQRTRSGTLGISQLESANFTVKAIGTTPTPSGVKRGGHTVSDTATGGTTTTLVDADQTWTTDQFVGDSVAITAGRGSGQSGTITGNTATTLTIGTPWALAPSESGTATGGSTTTLTRTGAGWAVDEWIGARVELTGGTGVDQAGVVTSNTADTVTIATAWTFAPDATTTYQLRSAYTISGTTSHTYYLVAKDGAGNKALCSLGFGVDNCLATATEDNWIDLFPTGGSSQDSVPVATYDILVERGVDRDGLAPNTPALLQADVPVSALNRFRDNGQPTLGAYTVPTSDATGACDLQGKTLSRVFPVTKTAAYTVTTSDDLIHANAGSAAFTLTLPAIDSAPNYQFTFRKVDNTANAVTIDGNGAETINGAASYTLSAEHEFVTVYNDGAGTTNWFAT